MSGNSEETTEKLVIEILTFYEIVLPLDTMNSLVTDLIDCVKGKGRFIELGF